MEKLVQELEAQLASLTQQRDDLYGDIEILCATASDTKPQAVVNALMKRAVDAERVRDQLSRENEAIRSEKASLIEDIDSIRESKHQADICCRELNARCEELERQKNLTGPQSTWIDDTKCNHEKIRDLEEELIKVAMDSDSYAQLEKANEEIGLLRERISDLEKSLNTCRGDLEEAQGEARRSEQNVSTLLGQLEKAKEGKGKKKKRSQSLRRRLDRLSLDLTKAVSKARSKEDALSETEAEMDCMRRQYTVDMSTVRDAFAAKLQDMNRMLVEKEQMIRSQHHAMQLLELENRKLNGQLVRRDQIMERLRDGRWRADEERAQAIEALANEREEEVLEFRKRIDGLEAKANALEINLHNAALKQENTEKRLAEATIKASAYKKRFLAAKMKIKANQDSVPLNEANLQLHNIATQWEDALQEKQVSRTRSKAGSICSMHTSVSLAQFALFALLMQGMKAHVVPSKQ